VTSLVAGWPEAGAHAGTALVCAGAAAWLATGSRGVRRRTRFLFPAGVGEAPRWTQRARASATALRARHGAEWWCVPGGLGLGLVAGSVLPVLAGLVALPLTRNRLRARDERREARAREAAVIELCADAAGELRAGRLPGDALLAVDVSVLGARAAAVSAAARFGGDLPEALRAAAALPGAEGLRGAAACWQVAADGGAGLAEGLDRVAAALRARRDQREELTAQLAGPRSTAAVLALLPVFGLFLGSAMGADPLRVLFHTPAGWGCLTLGCLLEWAGLAWVARLVRTAEEGEGR
jgi:tight adherence protein B